MRVIDRDTGTTKKRKKPQALPPMRSPKGFAVDITPSNVKVSKADRGKTILMRSSFETYLAKHDDRIGPGQKRAVQLLKQDRNQLLLPQNRQYLAALQRTQPGEELHNAVMADKHAARQYRLLRGGLAVPPQSRLKLMQHGMKPEEIDKLGARTVPAEQLAATVSFRKVKQAQAMVRREEKKRNLPEGALSYDVKTQSLIPTQVAGGWFGRFFGGAMEAGMGAAALPAAVISTRGRVIPRMGVELAKSFAETATHPIRQFEQDPFTFLSNLAVPVTLGASGYLRGMSAAGAVSKAAEASRLGIPLEESGIHGTAAGRFSPVARAFPEGAPQAAVHGFLNPEYRGLMGAYYAARPGARARLRKEEEALAGRMGETAEARTPQPHQMSIFEEGAQQAPHEPPPRGMPEPDVIPPKIPLRNVRARARRVGAAAVATKANVVADIKATHKADMETVKNIQDKQWLGWTGPVGAHVAQAVAFTAREATDGIRALTILGHIAYLPNNWAGNALMNMVHQGIFAPVNLTRAWMMHRHLTPDELAQLRVGTGQNSLQVLHGGHGRGHMRALFDPVAKTFGKWGDQPFRDAALLHELYKQGYHTLKDVKDLARRSHEGDPKARADLAKAGVPASEEVVKFGPQNKLEEKYFRHAFFVYNWTKGATRYGMRFPIAHPLQANVAANLGGTVGAEYTQKRVGGLPPFLAGHVPVGGQRMINLFGTSPLSTGIGTGRAVAGTLQEFFPGTFGKFDPYTGEDWTDLLPPIPGAAIQATRGVGGRSALESIYRNVGPYKLYQGLAHPGSGKIFPGTRMEAIGHFVFGSLYPRKYDPQAIQESLERIGKSKPEMLIEGVKERYKKKFGRDIPPEIVSAYRKDLDELKAQKDFKDDYVHDHNRSSYEKLPGWNKMESAYNYLKESGHLPPETLQMMRTALNTVKDEALAESTARSWWALTNVGHAKTTWNEWARAAKSTELKRKAPG